MQYDDNNEKSRQYLRIALEMIGKHGIPTDPLNYCVWYEYASGKNRALNTAIENHLQSNGVFSGEICRQLFNQYIAGQGETITTLVSVKLNKIFAEIIESITTTRQNFSHSENNLTAINESIVASLSDSDLEQIVNQIRHEIKNLESSTGSFKVQLERANREIDQLKAKLARYRKETIKDPLTRIHNRRGFDKTLKDCIGKTSATETSLCLIIADIDHFKRINDTHGHLVGDNVLKMVAATFKECIKGKDLAARIGGEEFAILLPDTPFEGAKKLANDMRLAFERLDLKKKSTGESLGKITLSFGVTSYKEPEDPKDFINRADQALYESKNSGRNKVTGF